MDSDKCIGCHGCEVSCKNENKVGDTMHWRKVHPLPHEYGLADRYFISLACNHCDSPDCLFICPVDAYTKRDDGIVVLDYEKCIGCRQCLSACPYGAPKFNEAKNKAEKCDFCAQRIDAGKKPACVSSCITEALAVHDFEKGEPAEGQKEFTGFRELGNTSPRIRFVPNNTLPTIVKRR